MIEIISKKKLPKFDSKHVYSQLGTAVQASSASYLALKKLASSLDVSQQEKEFTYKGLIERVERLISEFAEVQKDILKHLNRSKTREKEEISSVLEASNLVLKWFKDLLESHGEKDKEVLLPILTDIKKIVFQLNGLKQLKIEAAVKMETTLEKYSKTERNRYSKTKPLAAKTKRRTINPPYEPVQAVIPPNLLIDTSQGKTAVEQIREQINNPIAEDEE
jgi:hypothetical protein